MRLFEMLGDSAKLEELSNLYNLGDLSKKKRKKDRYKGVRNKRIQLRILTRDNYICRYCGGYGNTVDHVIPHSKGGTNDEGNLVCACEDCNVKKGNELAYGLDYVLNLDFR